MPLCRGVYFDSSFDTSFISQGYRETSAFRSFSGATARARPEQAQLYTQPVAAILPEMSAQARSYIQQRHPNARVGDLAGRMGRLAVRMDRVRAYEKRHYAESSRTGALGAAVTHWFDYCLGEAGVHPLRPDCSTLTPAEQDAEFDLDECWGDNLFHDLKLRASTIDNYRSMRDGWHIEEVGWPVACLLYTSPSPRDLSTSRMPSSA